MFYPARSMASSTICAVAIRATARARLRQGSPVPSTFFPVRAGFLRILRLRLVDVYGQFVDLAGSSDTRVADPSKILNTQPLQFDPNHPSIESLPPRFTSTARLWFRYTPADGSSTKDATADAPPVCGYLLPNHLDGDLEFFDADGFNLGVVRPDADSGILWEDAPGTPSTIGQTPARAIANQFRPAWPRDCWNGDSLTQPLPPIVKMR